MRIASLVLVILLAFTFSCGPIWGEGNKFDASKRDQIVKSRTTASELESLMGKPYKVEKKQAIPLESVKAEIESQLTNQKMRSEMEALTSSIKPELNQAYFRAFAPAPMEGVVGPAATPVPHPAPAAAVAPKAAAPKAAAPKTGTAKPAASKQ